MGLEINIIKEILKGIFVKEGVILSEITEDEELSLLGLNSISAIELVVSLEKEFDITIEIEDLSMENYSTVSNIKKLLSKYL